MRQGSSAGCFTAAVVAFSRFFLFFAWIARPVAFQAVFGGSWILPCLGIMVLPFTTLMYVILVTNGGVAGFDYVWLALAVLLDLAGAGAAAANNRNYIPQGVPGSLPPTSTP
ncbi:MAG TPA: hypothetical protein VMJ64_08420 [Anaerolineales bacterium]|nr:hypothetical protein [Anaerolineales bacterium]